MRYKPKNLIAVPEIHARWRKTNDSMKLSSNLYVSPPSISYTHTGAAANVIIIVMVIIIKKKQCDL